MIVVSDASPLIALATVGHLDLMRQLYAQVLVPEAVMRETTLANASAPGAAVIAAAPWIQVRGMHDRTLVEALALELDRGEAEAIALAVEYDADLLLMDERRGRRVASRLGRRIVGVLGVLIDAKQRDLVPAVRPLLDALATEVGFRVSP